jgi:two-component system, NarL family, response regulator DevR
MIRVFVVDDHPALRAGVRSILDSEPGLEFAGSASRARRALDSLEDVRPDVALVDYRLTEENGLTLCHRVKRLPHPPRVLIYSAFSDPTLGIAAAVAGADGLLSKNAPPDELLDAIRMVARGRTVLPAPPPERIGACAAKLDPEDVPVFAMLMERLPGSEIAEVLGIDDTDLAIHVKRVLGRLGVDTRQTAERL